MKHLVRISTYLLSFLFVMGWGCGEPEESGDYKGSDVLYEENFDSLGGKFTCNNRTCNWVSEIIDISGAENITIKADARSYLPGELDPSDYLRMFYRIDSSNWVRFFNHSNDLSPREISEDVSGTGSSLEIKIESRTSYRKETYEVDNLLVTGELDTVVLELPYHETFDSLGGSFTCSNKTCSWVSDRIDISDSSDLTITADATCYELGEFDPDDYLRMFYKIDGNDWVRFFGHTGDLNPTEISETVSHAGSRLEIKIESRTSFVRETYEVDDLRVRAGGGSDGDADGDSDGDGDGDGDVEVLEPQADAYVNRNAASTNYGSAPQLFIDTTPEEFRSLLRFSVPDMGSTIRRATLRVYVTNETSDGPKVYLASNNWQENTVTWNNQPGQEGSMIADFRSMPIGWREIDVTEAVSGSGLYSFILLPDSDNGGDFDSREGLNHPELVVDTRETPEENFFTIGFMPDTQYLVNDNGTCKRENLSGMFENFIETADELNTLVVAHLGDLTQGESEELKDETDGEEWDADPNDWERFMNGYETIQDTSLPFLPCRGNHDAREYFVDNFPVSDYHDESFFGGYYEQLYNAYYLFSAAGHDIIVLVLDYHVDSSYPNSIVTWANDVLRENSDRIAIVVSHNHGKILNRIVRNNDNVYMAIMGHSARDVHWTQESVGGRTQHIFVFDYQNYGDHNCESAVIRYFTFVPSEDVVRMRTYSVHEERYFTNDDCYGDSDDSGYRCQENDFPFS